MSQTDTPAIANAARIRERIAAACQDLEERHPGYREHVGEVTEKVIGLVIRHQEQRTDINQQILEILSRAGSHAHEQMHSHTSGAAQ